MVILVLSADTASADTITVDIGREEDYTSIQKAIDNANPGDTILVYPGTYKENIVVDRELKITSKSGNPEDTVILAATQKEHVFNVVSDNVIIKGFGIKNAAGVPGNYKYGIFLDGTENCRIDSNYISNNREAVYLINSSNNTLINNKFSENGDGGVILRYSHSNTIKNNLASGNIAGIVVIYFSGNNTVDGNKVSENILGIDVQGNNNTITNNTVQNNEKYGIGIEFSADSTISNNTVNSNERNGIWIEFSNNNTLKKNILSSNGMDGLFLLYSKNNTLSGNNASNNLNHGISLMDCDHNVIENNIVNRNNANGINLWNKGTEIDDDAIFEWGGSEYNILDSNNASGNSAYGIYIGISSNDNTLKNNSIYSNGKHGIFLAEASSNKELENNSISSNLQGDILVSSNATAVGISELSRSENGASEASPQNYGKDPEIPFIDCFMTIAIIGTASIFIKGKQE